jgi:hypothetical protein
MQPYSDPHSDHDAVIRVYDEAGNVIATHEHAADFKVLEPVLEVWPWII